LNLKPLSDYFGTEEDLNNYKKSYNNFILKHKELFQILDKYGLFEEREYTSHEDDHRILMKEYNLEWHIRDNDKLFKEILDFATKKRIESKKNQETIQQYLTYEKFIHNNEVNNFFREYTDDYIQRKMSYFNIGEGYKYSSLYIDDYDIEVTDERLAQFIKEVCAVPTDFSNQGQLLFTLSKALFSGQYGDKMSPFTAQINPNFTGDVTYHGHENVILNGDYGQEFTPVLDWTYNVRASKENPIELWLEFEKEDIIYSSCEHLYDVLPAMDDDDYRRGRLTSHKKFGEDMAILAGDSLFLDPYGLLARAELPSQVKVDLISELSLAAGSFGMVAGQVLDMQGEGQAISLEDLKTIHANKTGKLLTYPFVAAGLIAGVEQSVQDKLRRIGELLGLAFQVRDDILDVTASFEELGKTPQKDLAAAKSTYPAFLGLDGAKNFFNQTLDEAVDILKDLEEKTEFSGEEIQKIIESLRLNG